MHLTKEDATDFFRDFYFGEHHFPSELKESGYGWCVTQLNASLSTYDFNHLTRLVVMAHDRCIRVELKPFGMNRLKIIITKRERDGGYSERHPTLEAAIEYIRSQDTTKPK